MSLAVEPALVTEILNDIQDAPGSLPLLQYTLKELWQRRQAGTLTLETYQALGGINGTLDKRATEIYNSFDSDQQRTVQHIFQQLTQLGEGTEDTRRRVFLENLVAEPLHPSSRVQVVIDKLSDKDNRLLVTSEVVGKGEFSSRRAIVDVAHEALIRHWRLLRQWIEQNRDLLRKQRRIEASTVIWQEHGQFRGYLLQGLPLVEAIQFQKERARTFPLSDSAKILIRKSVWKQHWNRLRIVSWLIVPTVLVVGLVEYRIREDIITTDYPKIESTNRSVQRQAIKSLVAGCQYAVIPQYFAERMFGNCRSLSGASLRESDLRESDLSNANLSEANLSSANLSGADLSNANLREANLSGADLSNANLSGADLSNANLSGADLHESALNRADLSNVDLRNAKLRKANLRNADLNRVDLRNTDLREVDLNRANLRNSDLNRTDLRNAQLFGAKLHEVDLNEAKLHEANLSEAKLYKVDLSNTTLNNATLSNAKFSEVDFNNATLSNAKFSEVDLSEANLSNVNLSNANLSFSNLHRANLSSADLSGANLRNANLSKAQLFGTDLSYAQLSGSNLRNANLISANLSKTDLISANLSFSNLSRASLISANLSKTDLISANFRNADFRKTDLSNANLSNANLSNANLSNANLSRAKLSRTDLSRTDLSETIFIVTDLRETRLLTQQQLEGEAQPFICNSPFPNNIKINGGKDRDCDQLAEILFKAKREFETLEDAENFVKRQRNKRWE
ncbi:MAG: pentapeptide repeat-containing protein [Cyanobacteria bacterium P01_F01_bin.53]